jgi:hypothetical protein
MRKEHRYHWKKYATGEIKDSATVRAAEYQMRNTKDIMSLRIIPVQRLEWEFRVNGDDWEINEASASHGYASSACARKIDLP